MNNQSGLKSLLTIEEQGIEPVSPSEQQGKPKELFWVWFAANISILGLPLGAWVIGGKLNLWQAILVALVGSIISFSVVGIVSIAGKQSGAPTLTISRAMFGVIGNYFPTGVAILSRWGWETVNSVTACFALLAIFQLSFGSSADPKQAPVLAIIAVLAFSLATLAVSGLGHRVLLQVEKWATWIFGILTLVIIGFLLTQVEWEKVLNAPAGDPAAVVVAISVVASGTGIAWANSGADIARYQKRSTSTKSLVLASALGAGIPLTIMITTGALLTLSQQEFDPDNPLSSIPALLPSWMAIPFLLAAFVGLLLSQNISVYSSGLTLLTLGLKVRRLYAVGGDLLVSLLGSLAFMFYFENFYNPFIGFIITLAIPLSAYLGVFLVDMWGRELEPRGLVDTSSSSPYWYFYGFRVSTCIAWLVGIIAGYSFYLPVLAKTWIGENGLAWLVSLLVAGILQIGGRKIENV